MVGNVDLDLLEKTYQNASMGITAIKAVLDKVSNKEMSSELQKQLNDYQRLADKSKQQLIVNNAEIKEPTYAKAMVQGNVKMKTLFDDSESRIAQMVIEGSTMGVTQMLKLLHAKKNADSTSVEIAQEFVRVEEEHIERMKKFL